jgi:hypothetical protein
LQNTVIAFDFKYIVSEHINLQLTTKH